MGWGRAAGAVPAPFKRHIRPSWKSWTPSMSPRWKGLGEKTLVWNRLSVRPQRRSQSFSSAPVRTSTDLPHKKTKKKKVHKETFVMKTDKRRGSLWSRVTHKQLNRRLFQSEIFESPPFAAKSFPSLHDCTLGLDWESKTQHISTVKHDGVHQEMVQWWTRCSIHNNINVIKSHSLKSPPPKKKGYNV